MKSCNMAVIVPVDKLAGNDEVLRAQVWGKVSELLLPALGKLYRQFNPSNGAWGLKLVRPFGVILGKQEPEQFLALFLAGQQAQQDAMEFHLSAMIEKTDMSNAQKIGDSLVCPMIVDGKDPELMAHATFLFYVVGASHSVFDVAYYFGIDSVKIDITLSPDCYEPLLFLNSIINMILYCQKEVRRLEAERNEQHLIFNGKEAA